MRAFTPVVCSTPSSYRYNSLLKRQEEELVDLLSVNPQSGELGTSHFIRIANDRTIDPAIRDVIRFHVLSTNEESKAAGQKLLSMLPKIDETQQYPEDEEIVEDAGLFDHEHALQAKGATRKRMTG